ncbi:MAG: TIGR02757 family protein [Bacteroidia bacterium]|nr:TIGR02757 family protein [Bacteroidia bacterium]
MKDKEFEEIKALLDSKFLQYNQPFFVEDDPIAIPHIFDRKEDIEISGFLTALIAWGRRPMIMKNARNLMARMDERPFEFVMNASEGELSSLDGYVHRTLNDMDTRFLVKGLRHAYTEFNGLEDIFAKGIKESDLNVFGGIMNARTILSSIPDFPQRTHKHLANPSRGSSAKRINMFLRWMVRDDHQGVDFGIWKSISPSKLICPLDVHTGNVARKLGLLGRKQNDWKAAEELTAILRRMHPQDPIRYDFALFGLGVYQEI